VLVKVPPVEAFRVFTEEIDQWWRHGKKYRVGKDRSIIAIEPKVGGRMFEAFRTAERERVVETGSVLVYDPPTRLVLDWRAVGFKSGERTEVEVLFEPSPSGTLVTVTHRGWAAIRDDHAVRHGEAAEVFVRSMGRWWGDLLGSLREYVLVPEAERTAPQN
jgi:uncharacterized protein YndB with AHSA1/START domain